MLKNNIVNLIFNQILLIYFIFFFPIFLLQRKSRYDHTGKTYPIAYNNTGVISSPRWNEARVKTFYGDDYARTDGRA